MSEEWSKEEGVGEVVVAVEVMDEMIMGVSAEE